jgi:tetratricopeptide (TPR) repeat protein
MRRFLLALLAGVMVWCSAAGAIAQAQPADLSSLREQAFAATQAGRFAEAEEYWTEILKQLPDSAAVWSNRGNVRVSQNHLEDALSDYGRAIELAPDAPDPYLNRGIALERMERWEAAIADYDRVLELSPDDAVAYNNRGNARAGMGDWSGAIADYQTATELMPTLSIAQANHALAVYQNGATQEAIREMRGLVRKYPKFADMRAALSAALWVAGQQGAAESNWVAAIGLDRRYKDLDWVANIRRWPPEMVAALDKFLSLE